jgi:RNA polymerase sigma-70 factor (ECF subfamily)
MPQQADDPSDEALMLAYARGRGNAFDALYARHRASVYRYLLRHCGERSVADELMQDVWMRVIRGRLEYAPTAKFATWLYTLAHNRLIDHWRAAGLRATLSMDADDCDNACAIPEISASPTDEPERRAANREMANRLNTALRALPILQRDAFLLQHESGLSLAEIAAVSDVGIETVKSRLRYAVAKLRESLRDVREAYSNGG